MKLVPVSFERQILPGTFEYTLNYLIDEEIDLSVFPVEGHLRALTARERTTILDAIERQLLHEPLMETRHRKPLRPNPIAPWELRVGQLRVFYEVAGAESRMVRVLAVGRKRRNVLLIGGEEIRL